MAQLPTRSPPAQPYSTPSDDAAAEKDTGRLEAFSDGVFSIAITLLALELRVPSLSGPSGPTARALWAELGRMWPSYLAFVTSFFTVLIMWVNHHDIFRLIRRTDNRLLFTNGLLLLLVTAVPFPTQLIATYLRTAVAGTACAVYGGLFVLISIAYGLLLLAAAAGDGRMLAAGAMPEVSRRTRDCFRVGTPLYLAATVAALLSPWVTLGICTGLWVFWSVGTGRRRALLKSALGR
jgi:uncharacterized membrane protein